MIDEIVEFAKANPKEIMAALTALILLVVGIMKLLSKSGTNIKQNQKGGHGSSNIQIGNINMTKGEK